MKLGNKLTNEKMVKRKKNSIIFADSNGAIKECIYVGPDSKVYFWSYFSGPNEYGCVALRARMCVHTEHVW